MQRPDRLERLPREIEPHLVRQRPPRGQGAKGLALEQFENRVGALRGVHPAIKQLHPATMSGRNLPVRRGRIIPW
jgi:hypothetical protein